MYPLIETFLEGASLGAVRSTVALTTVMSTSLLSPFTAVFLHKLKLKPGISFNDKGQ